MKDYWQSAEYSLSLLITEGDKSISIPLGGKFNSAYDADKKVRDILQNISEIFCYLPQKYKGSGMLDIYVSVGQIREYQVLAVPRWKISGYYFQSLPGMDKNLNCPSGCHYPKRSERSIE